MAQLDTTIETAPVDALRAQLAAIELDVTTSYTLADAIREGSTVTTQKISGFGAGSEACALSAAAISAKARGYLT